MDIQVKRNLKKVVGGTSWISLKLGMEFWLIEIKSGEIFFMHTHGLNIYSHKILTIPC